MYVCPKSTREWVLTSFLSFPVPAKADKKAAQVKVQQQENKRQEREGELRAMARKIRMK